MKNKRLETMGRRMREYHRHHQWRLSAGGLFIPHAYWDMTPDSLSGWDDVGFILNGRRYIVWWQHPRAIYQDAIETMAYEEVGPGPDRNWLFDGATTLYKKVGKAGRRKKPIGHRSRESSEAQQTYYVQLRETIDRVSDTGIEMEIRPSWTWERLNWAMGINLVAPIEVRNELELAELADLAKRLVLQQTTLAREFPDAVYDRSSWLMDQEIKSRSKAQVTSHAAAEYQFPSSTVKASSDFMVAVERLPIQEREIF
jgi:hypothetical protein